MQQVFSEILKYFFAIFRMHLYSAIFTNQSTECVDCRNREMHSREHIKGKAFEYKDFIADAINDIFNI